MVMSRIELEPEGTFRAAGRSVVGLRTRELFERADGVLDGGDPEAVHKTRVATRRLRAALEVFGAALPRKRTRATLAEVKELADALGARRDCDVLIDLLESLRPDVDRAGRAAADQVLGELRAEQQQATARVGEAIKAVRRSKLEKRLRELVR
jgi:CHAD domain-containing protein